MEDDYFIFPLVIIAILLFVLATLTGIEEYYDRIKYDESIKQFCEDNGYTGYDNSHHSDTSNRYIRCFKVDEKGILEYSPTIDMQYIRQYKVN